MTDINRVELFGCFGADVEIRHRQSGREIAVFSLATDTGYFDKERASEFQRSNGIIASPIRAASYKRSESGDDAAHEPLSPANCSIETSAIQGKRPTARKQRF
jgi:hypothetical protein